MATGSVSHPGNAVNSLKARSASTLEMLGGVANREPRCRRQRFDAAPALSEPRQEFQAVSVTERLGHGGDVRQQYTLGGILWHEHYHSINH